MLALERQKPEARAWAELYVVYSRILNVECLPRDPLISFLDRSLKRVQDAMHSSD